MTYKNANIKQFDGVRAIAILSIVACHLCYGFNAMSPVGQYLGGTFNFVFFLLSALLIGISVKKRKCLSGGGVKQIRVLEKTIDTTYSGALDFSVSLHRDNDFGRDTIELQSGVDELWTIRMVCKASIFGPFMVCDDDIDVLHSVFHIAQCQK